MPKKSNTKSNNKVVVRSTSTSRESSMDDIANFFKKYGGAIIGAIIAIIILATRFYELILWILFICLGLFLGNYVQHNKELVKDKLKEFIDRM